MTRTSTAGSRSSALSASTVTVSFQPRWGIVAAKRCNSRMPSPGTARRCGFCGSCALDTQVPTHRRIADRAISSSGTTARSCQVLSLKQKCPESIIGPGTLAAVRTTSMPSRIDGIALAACIRRACPRLPRETYSDRDAQRRPVRLNAAAREPLTAWIDRYPLDEQ